MIRLARIGKLYRLVRISKLIKKLKKLTAHLKEMYCALVCQVTSVLGAYTIVIFKGFLKLDPIVEMLCNYNFTKDVLRSGNCISDKGLCLRCGDMVCDCSFNKGFCWS